MWRGTCSLLLLPLVLGSVVVSYPEPDPILYQLDPIYHEMEPRERLLERTIECPEDLITCKDQSNCIRRSYVCDGDQNCRDASDERNCAIPFPVDQFTCEDRSKHISRNWVCDGDQDCPDGSDERDCASCTVPSEIERALQRNETLRGSVVAHRTRVIMDCKTNFTLARRGPSICYNGTWRHYLRCWLAPCSVPSFEFARDRSVFGTLVPHGEEFRVECEDNYVPTFSPYCNSGTWDSIPRCVPAAPCIVPSENELGINRTLVETTVRHDEVFRVRCEENYMPTYPYRHRCNNGAWDSIPRCEPASPCIVQNMRLTDPSLDGTSIKHGTSVEVECQDELTFSTCYNGRFNFHCIFSGDDALPWYEE